jgi:hypothetical protein
VNEAKSEIASATNKSGPRSPDDEQNQRGTDRNKKKLGTRAEHKRTDDGNRTDLLHGETEERTKKIKQEN